MSNNLPMSFIKLPWWYVPESYLIPNTEYGLCPLEDVEEMIEQGWEIVKTKPTT